MSKLPLPFKQQGMAVHKQFDQIADKVEQGAPANEILLDLSEQLGSCVACHSLYRLDAEAGAKKQHIRTNDNHVANNKGVWFIRPLL